MAYLFNFFITAQYSSFNSITYYTILGQSIIAKMSMSVTFMEGVQGSTAFCRQTSQLPWFW